jgi:hypothetical protein
MKNVIFACLILNHSFALAQDLGAHESQGLKDTKTFLHSPEQRKEFINKDKAAKEIDDKVSALAGSSKNKEELYGISSEVLEKLVQETKGDPQKMQQILQEAQTNPQKFYEKYFDENAKARVRGVASDIDSKGVKPKSPR